MKTLNIIALLASVVAVGLSCFAIITRPRNAPATGTDPKTLVVESFQDSRWDGTHEFFRNHRAEMSATVEVANFHETDGVGIAFIRTSANGKKFQFAEWMRRTTKGWERVGYLSPHLNGNPFLAKWIEQHKEWLQEMQTKIDEWEKQSDGAW